jgi:hypothetical protein
MYINTQIKIGLHPTDAILFLVARIMGIDENQLFDDLKWWVKALKGR